MLIKNFAIQLYSIRNEIESLGFPVVLQKLSDIGYTGVELAGYGGLSATEMRFLLQKTGLKPVSAHIGLEQLESAFDEEIAYHKTLGTPCLIVPYARFGNAEDVRRLAGRLAALAPKVKDAGFTFAYHNHDDEFVRDGDTYRMEDIMELAPETDVQLDLYWAARMNCDCAAFIREHAPRIVSLHVKQMDAAGNSADLDDGVLDFSLLIRTGLENGIKTFIHEQEAFSGDPFEGLRKGFKHIMSL